MLDGNSEIPFVTTIRVVIAGSRGRVFNNDPIGVLLAMGLPGEELSIWLSAGTDFYSDGRVPLCATQQISSRDRDPGHGHLPAKHHEHFHFDAGYACDGGKLGRGRQDTGAP